MVKVEHGYQMVYSEILKSGGGGKTSKDKARVDLDIKSNNSRLGVGGALSSVYQKLMTKLAAELTQATHCY